MAGIGVFLALGASAFAGMSDLVATQQAFDEQESGSSGTTAGAAHVAGAGNTSVTNGREYSLRRRNRSWFTISAITSFMGPAVNNLDGHLPPPSLRSTSGGSAPSGGASPAAGGNARRGARNGAAAAAPVTSTSTAAIPVQTSPGSSLRYMVAAGVHVADDYTLGPVLNMSQKLYGPTSGDLRFDDPQARLSISDVIRTRIGGHRFNSSLWLAVSAPTSQLSRDTHQITTFGVSFIPRLHFNHSDFTLSGMSSIKTAFVNKDTESGVIMPSRLFAGLQVAYRLSQPLTPFIMSYTAGQLGPEVAMTDVDLTADPNDNRGKRRIGVMPGMLIRATDFISVSPRLNWIIGKPLDTTTVGLNANIQMI